MFTLEDQYTLKSLQQTEKDYLWMKKPGWPLTSSTTLKPQDKEETPVELSAETIKIQVLFVAGGNKKMFLLNKSLKRIHGKQFFEDCLQLTGEYWNMDKLKNGRVISITVMGFSTNMGETRPIFIYLVFSRINVNLVL